VTAAARATLTAMRFLLTHPSETRPSLVVDTCPAIEDATVERLRTDLHGLGCPNGLLFDAERCVILRDTYSSMSADSIIVEAEQPATDAVLAKAGPGTLDERVAGWLEMLSVRWDSALPLEPAVAAPFIADIVPAASGSMLYALKGAA
jgi:hypothetical protein